MRSLVVASICCSIGCGRVGFDPRNPDATLDADDTGDGASSDAAEDGDRSRDADVDAVTDMDASFDAPMDALTDAGTDSEMDGAVDAMVDAPFDATSDAPLDAPPDTGPTDAGTDAGDGATGGRPRLLEIDRFPQTFTPVVPTSPAFPLNAPREGDLILMYVVVPMVWGGTCADPATRGATDVSVTTFTALGSGTSGADGLSWWLFYRYRSAFEPLGYNVAYTPAGCAAQITPAEVVLLAYTDARMVGPISAAIFDMPWSMDTAATNPPTISTAELATEVYFVTAHGFDAVVDPIMTVPGATIQYSVTRDDDPFSTSSVVFDRPSSASPDAARVMTATSASLWAASVLLLDPR